jgi:hypothetical protein
VANSRGTELGGHYANRQNRTITTSHTAHHLLLLRGSPAAGFDGRLWPEVNS